MIDEQFKVTVNDEGLWIETEEAMWQIEPEEAMELARLIFKQFASKLGN